MHLVGFTIEIYRVIQKDGLIEKDGLNFVRLYGMWMIYIPPLERSPSAQPCSRVSWEQNGYYAAQDYLSLVLILKYRLTKLSQSFWILLYYDARSYKRHTLSLMFYLNVRNEVCRPLVLRSENSFLYLGNLPVTSCILTERYELLQHWIWPSNTAPTGRQCCGLKHPRVVRLAFTLRLAYFLCGAVRFVYTACSSLHGAVFM